ncbi:MAG: DUF262 domain-containing protein [Bacteroidales bacterium]|nr:DUF262 domain-containing protein [Bacteroidales bacterium]
MGEKKIEIKSVGELLGMKFFIPSYQRGYRWTEQQVKDLLNDIWEFSQKNDKRNGEFYCLQPLVVKSREEDILTQIKSANTIEDVKSLLKGSWEVIDGQQRLTTIFIILFIILFILNREGDKQYTLSYETRNDFREFLDKIIGIDDCSINNNEEANAKFKEIVGVENNKKKSWDNIDFYHLFVAFVTIKKWFGEKDKEAFKKILLDNVKFIWYETEETDSIKVFTRLNIGKISLTNAELIKALFLNRSNFGNEDGNHLRLRQQEIASEWDNIEYTLQNEEFWLFLHENGYDRPTRIDFIFDLICEQNAMRLSEKLLESIGTDEYKTFRYFYEYFKQGNKVQPKIEDCWKEVKKYFQTFQEWFNDLELYHYVGYLVEYNQSVAELVKIWRDKSTKIEFIEALKKKIKDTIKDCKDLNKQYEISGSPKTQCRPLLLLHNIQTIINQSKDFTNKKEYELPVFYKFPFHLFKKEKWDVEHIDSNSENDMSDKDSQNEFLLNIYLSVNDDIQKKIEAFINDPNAPNWSDFNEYTKKVKDSLSDEEKNQVWNFTLLDFSTNRSYGNSIFAAKRRIIIGKDRGVELPIPKIKRENNQSKLSVGKEVKAKTAFIPLCTKNIFLKYYTPVLTNYNYWTKPDAKAYRQNILNTLEEFGVTDSSNNQNEDKNEQQ